MIALSRLVALVDLTNLDEKASQEDIKQLVTKASTPLGPVASVCVYPQWIPFVRKYISSEVKITTVCNFPAGDLDLDSVRREIESVVELGANEIDVVVPYQAFKKGLIDDISAWVKQCKTACQGRILKTILETGELNAEQTKELSKQAIAGGTDFLKTSTGKVSEGATLNAVEVMLNSIVTHHKVCGIKVSGGVRTLEDVDSYLDLIERVCGKQFATAGNICVRFGTSGLLDTLQL